MFEPAARANQNRARTAPRRTAGSGPPQPAARAAGL